MAWVVDQMDDARCKVKDEPARFFRTISGNHIPSQKISPLTNNPRLHHVRPSHPSTRFLAREIATKLQYLLSQAHRRCKIKVISSNTLTT
jgi:hypothetical protein